MVAIPGDIVGVDCRRLPSVGARGARRGPAVDTSEAPFPKHSPLLLNADSITGQVPLID